MSGSNEKESSDGPGDGIPGASHRGRRKKELPRLSSGRFWLRSRGLRACRVLLTSRMANKPATCVVVMQERGEGTPPTVAGENPPKWCRRNCPDLSHCGLSRVHSVEVRFTHENEATERWGGLLYSKLPNAPSCVRSHVERLEVKPPHRYRIVTAQE